jgi:hypothetical protein
LINKTPIKHMNADVCRFPRVFRHALIPVEQIVLLGNADAVVQHLCRQLDWELPPAIGASTGRGPRDNLRKRSSNGVAEAPFIEEAPQRVANRFVFSVCSDHFNPNIIVSHVWLFTGAEGGDLVDDIEKLASGPSLSRTASSCDEPIESDLSSLESSPEPEEETVRQAKRRKVS